MRLLVGLLSAWLSFALANTTPVFAADCDIAILNGRVIDPENSFDDVRNVCVQDGKIAGITSEKISGSEIVDADGVAYAREEPLAAAAGELRRGIQQLRHLNHRQRRDAAVEEKPRQDLFLR